MTDGRLLIVDDETAQMRALCDTLGMEGYTTRGFDSPQAALAALRPGEFDLLLTDLQMPEMDGIALIAAVRQIDPEIGAIVMTGHGTIDTAVLAMRNGALDYILKPFRLNVVLPVIVRAQDLLRLRRENVALQKLERQRTEELAAAYQDLESFSYSISHDLRAPLLFVKDFAARLEHDYAERLGEEGRHVLQVIGDGCRSMDEMVVGLLAFSRATRQPLNLRQLDMLPVVRTAVAEARAAWPEPEAEVEIGELPAAAADPAVIRHVWGNLVGNAFKYSARRNPPRIRISGRVAGAETIYSVEDNGAGFDMQYADKLFGVFKRLHSSKEFQGTGVGLAIAHRIIARHGGRIWVQAEPDKGARFEFALPATAGTDVTAAAGPSSS
ncbi:MAG TPA: response regulator [Steroidobacteraceae bacterium]|nr:response regulator [Steroidobacteraceae bacterium]